MGNQGQNMFTILMSEMKIFVFEKSVRMIYFLVIKQLNVSKNTLRTKSFFLISKCKEDMI